MATRLEILERSLKNKEQVLNQKINADMSAWSATAGTPLNDKMHKPQVRSFVNQREQARESIFRQFREIEKTQNAIEREKARLEFLDKKDELSSEILASPKFPTVVLEMLEQGILKQWRKYPNYFFVTGVEMGRIIVDPLGTKIKQKKYTKKSYASVRRSYTTEIPTQEQKELFFKVWNAIRDGMIEQFPEFAQDVEQAKSS